jgi:GTP cyclohydrolase III
MVVTTELSEEYVSEKLCNYSYEGLPVKFGIGRAQTARKAAELASMNLEHARHRRNGWVISPDLRDSI